MPTLPKTTVEKTGQVDQKWFVLDGDAYIVGRLATHIATVLMGKHKASYTPHVDTGDYVIVTNVERVRFSGGPAKHDSHPYPTTKMASKIYDRYTGYPGGRKTLTAIEVWERKPEQILREAVRRMLPKNKLGRHMLDKLKLYVGPDHPHSAQQPEPMPEYLLPKNK
ncbi:MAG: 50S ribosomal protein L13 [Planctomycetaceae bacterium]